MSTTAEGTRRKKTYPEKDQVTFSTHKLTRNPLVQNNPDNESFQRQYEFFSTYLEPCLCTLGQRFDGVKQLYAADWLPDEQRSSGGRIYAAKLRPLRLLRQHGIPSADAAACDVHQPDDLTDVQHHERPHHADGFLRPAVGRSVLGASKPRRMFGI